MNEQENYQNKESNLRKTFSSNKINTSQNNNSKTIKGNFKHRLIKTNKTNFNSLINLESNNNTDLKNTNLTNSNNLINNKNENLLLSPKFEKFSNRNKEEIKEPETEKEKNLINKYVFYSKKGDKENFLITIEQLINENINLNYIDKNGFSALHYAVDEGNLKICEILIQTKKVNINIKSIIDNKTPLHISCKNGYFDITKLLIQNKADLNCLDNENNNPLLYCVKGNYYEVIKMILSQNHDYNLILSENIYGESPLSIAIKSNEKINNLFKEYVSLILSKKKINHHQNKKYFNTRNQKNILNKNEKNTHSKGVLYNNVNNNSCNKKLNSYVSKNNFNNSNNISKYSNQNTSTLCDSSNNSIKKSNHISSMSSLPKESINRNKKQIDKQNIIINKNLNKKNNPNQLKSYSSFKGISNIKTRVQTNTIGTMNSITNTNNTNSIIKSSVSSLNKDSVYFDNKINHKKQYKKCIHQKINKQNIINKNHSKSHKNNEKKYMKKENPKRIIIELNDSDIKNNKIKKIEIDLIDDIENKNFVKSRNSNVIRK